MDGGEMLIQADESEMTQRDLDDLVGQYLDFLEEQWDILMLEKGGEDVATG